MVNAWIRQPGHFDGVIDFARATADPHNAQIVNPIYDGATSTPTTRLSGDGQRHQPPSAPMT